MVKEEISAQKKIALTTDIWTTEHATFSVISMTAHFISFNSLTNELEPNVRIVAVTKMKGSHTGEQIKEKLQFGIDAMSIEKVSILG